MKYQLSKERSKRQQQNKRKSSWSNTRCCWLCFYNYCFDFTKCNPRINLCCLSKRGPINQLNTSSISVWQSGAATLGRGQKNPFLSSLTGLYKCSVKQTRGGWPFTVREGTGNVQCGNLRLWHKDFLTGTINCNRLWLRGVLRGLTPMPPVYGMSWRGWGQNQLSSFVSTGSHHTPCWGGARFLIAQGQTFPPELQGANARRSPLPDREATVYSQDLSVKEKK